MRPARFTPDGGTKTMAAKVRPLHNRLIVQRVQDEEKTRGGIIIPDTAKEKPTEGKVIAAGPGKRDEKGNLVAMDVKKGDRVLFSKYGGSEVTLDGEDYLIVSEDEVLAVLE
jgi:chaperonin GroES